MRISLRRSFKVTSAARTSRLDAMPVAIADIVLIEHGATTIPSVGVEPLAMLAPMSSTGCQEEANCLKIGGCFSNFEIGSAFSRAADRRWVSKLPVALSFSRSLQP